MSSKVSPAAIGAFVLGAIGLAVIGLLVFGSGQFFKQSTKFISFFTGDVSGLKIGAPVLFKGVEIGSVVDIRIRVGTQPTELTSEMIVRGIRIPVIMEVDNQKLTAQGARPLLDPQWLKTLIDLGLRAQLVSQSFVTGLLQVQLDFQPDRPPTFMGAADVDLPEIPTIPTSIEQVRSAAQEIAKRLEQIDLNKLVASVTEAFDGITSVTRAPGLHTALEGLPETEANLNQTVTSLRKLADGIESQRGPLLQSLRGTSDQAGVAFERAQGTVDNLQTMIGPNAPLIVELRAALQEFRGAARSVRLLADYLERNPSALVRGRSGEEE